MAVNYYASSLVSSNNLSCCFLDRTSVHYFADRYYLWQICFILHPYLLQCLYIHVEGCGCNCDVHCVVWASYYFKVVVISWLQTQKWLWHLWRWSVRHFCQWVWRWDLYIRSWDYRHIFRQFCCHSTNLTIVGNENFGSATQQNAKHKHSSR